MDTGIWVFLGYFLVALMLVITIAVVYFTVILGPKIRAFFLLMNRFIAKIKEQNENLDNVSQDILKLMEQIKDIFKK